MSTSSDEILYQGPGYTIARVHKASTLVPYHDQPRPDGNVNHGFFDLRNKPHLVDTIPEASKSKGLREILLVVAKEGSALMTIGCECGLFDEGDSPERPRYQVGGFVDIAFKDPAKNAEEEELINLAGYILNGIPASDEHLIGFEMLITPLKTLFGQDGCFELMCKPLGRGDTEVEAWAAFDHAAFAIANSLCRDNEEGIALRFPKVSEGGGS